MRPLAARLRPQTLADFVGQKHLLGPNKALYQSIAQGQLHSMILWGPPGTGKTTLAQLFASQAHARFIQLSAVTAGVKDIREALLQAELSQKNDNAQTILFIDEVHRFNKSQQDALLPGIEEGIITFIGATTENPGFELNKALLSRARVYTLKSLTQADILAVFQRALVDKNEGYASRLDIPLSLQTVLAEQANGDLRRALNLLELTCEYCLNRQKHTLEASDLESLLSDPQAHSFDKQGDVFYEQISALHKSVRGSNPDGALYWLARMLAGGCDPIYLARRITRISIEDIGLADPRAIELSLNAWEIQKRLGSPEGELALAQAVVYLSVAAKSNAVYKAFQKAQNFVQTTPNWPVPLHLRNASNTLLKSLDYGRDYVYDHDSPKAHAAGQNYLPSEAENIQFYEPTDRGLEKKIKEKLDYLRSKSAE